MRAAPRHTKPCTAIRLLPSSPCTMQRRLFSESTAPSSPEGDKQEAAEKVEAANEKAQDPMEVLKHQNEKLQEEVKTLKDKLLRSYAEEENVRRIAQRDVNSAKEYANTKFAKSLLDVADNLERAIAAIDQEQRATGDSHFLNLLEGVEMTQKGLVKAFESHGVVRVSICLPMFNLFQGFLLNHFIIL